MSDRGQPPAYARLVHRGLWCSQTTSFSSTAPAWVSVPVTVDLIQKIRSSGPSRRVGGGNRAGCALYPSRKMGFGIQAESINCELIFIRQCEHDNDVLELYDQPGMIWLECKTAGGRPNPRCHYPDFLILARHWAGWVECKTENELARREQKGDQQFIRGDDGGWISPQGGDYAARFGLVYRVWTNSKVNWVEHRNLNYLKSYFRDVRFNLDDVAKKEVLLAVKKREGVARFGTPEATDRRDSRYGQRHDRPRGHLCRSRSRSSGKAGGCIRLLLVLGGRSVCHFHRLRRCTFAHLQAAASLLSPAAGFPGETHPTQW